ncbi:hypothetical protein BGZ57DRAFT_481932 [Hyaloscypha finlandica]|nr:hypothetical protein BGZ57DRAFT_481932 [Hyaloscypha finlandica]
MTTTFPSFFFLLSSLANPQFMEISTHLVAFLQNDQHPLFTSFPFRLAKNSSTYEVTSSHFILWHFAWSLFTFPVFASFTKLVQFLHHNFADTREESALNSLSPRCHKFKTLPSSQLHDISPREPAASWQSLSHQRLPTLTCVSLQGDISVEDTVSEAFVETRVIFLQELGSILRRAHNLD